MNPDTSSNRAGPDRVLPLVTLGLAAWQALPSLVSAWGNDVYARGAPLAFGIWLAVQGFMFLKNPGPRAVPGVPWIVVSLSLCAAGSMSGLRVLHHLAMATAVTGLFGMRMKGMLCIAAALTWLPASGWFLSRWKSGGLAGWERLALMLLLAAPMLLDLIKPQPSKP